MAHTGQTRHHHKFFVITLSILFSLFCFRVLAQLTQLYVELPFLPPFDAWQSGAVPYWFLLLTQFLIIAFYGWILWRFATNRVLPNRREGWVFFVIGLIYFFAMAMRLVVGVSGLSQHIWFRSYLPTLFHFVISGYLIVVGYFHIQATVQRR